VVASSFLSTTKPSSNITVTKNGLATPDSGRTDVIIVGAGPTGLTLACDLARRGVSLRIIEKAAEPFNGSKGKGVQPRTLEVFDDLGVVHEILSAGSPYPRMNAHLWFLRLKWHMPQAGAGDTGYSSSRHLARTPVADRKNTA